MCHKQQLEVKKNNQQIDKKEWPERNMRKREFENNSHKIQA